MSRSSSSVKLLLCLGVLSRAQDFGQDPSDMTSLCPSATDSSAWADYTSCGESLVTAVWGATPCATIATSTGFGPEMASCNCGLYKDIAATCLPHICDTKGLDEFSVSTLSSLCAYTTAAGGGSVPTTTGHGGGAAATSTRGGAGASPTTGTSTGGVPKGTAPVAGGVVMGFFGALAAFL